MGKVALKLPLPPGSLLSLYNDDTRFVKSYMSEFPGYYQTGGIVHSNSSYHQMLDIKTQKEMCSSCQGQTM
jgi:propionyl-CoA synthetase